MILCCKSCPWRLKLWVYAAAGVVVLLTLSALCDEQCRDMLVEDVATALAGGGLAGMAMSLSHAASMRISITARLLAMFMRREVQSGLLAGFLLAMGKLALHFAIG